MSIAAAGSAAVGTTQAMQQAVASMKAAVESQQAATEMLTQAAEDGAALAASGSRGTNLNITF
jgi:alkylation response protein AidB-like acyl-CoA dehydrogenase